MSEKRKRNTVVGKSGGNKKSANSAALARSGIRTARDLGAVMAALVSDVLCCNVAPNVANASCNAAGKLLKTVEMQFRYGKRTLELLEAAPVVPSRR